MQPFTDPELIRIIHEDKVRDALGHRAREADGWSLSATQRLRRAVAGLLIEIGARLAPPAEREVTPAQVIHIPPRRVNGRPGPEDAAEDEARVAMRAAGLSTQRTERLIGFYRLVRAGLCAPVTPDVEVVLGRAARRFSSFVDDHYASWYADHPAAPAAAR